MEALVEILTLEYSRIEAANNRFSDGAQILFFKSSLNCNVLCVHQKVDELIFILNSLI